MHPSDLYFILFSYFRNQKVYCISIYTLAYSKEDQKFFSKKSGYELNKMTYREFESWWEHRQWYDSNLLNQKEEYGIRLEFVSALVDFFIKEKNISLDEFYYGYKPLYPWSQKVLKTLDYFLDSTNENIFWEKSLKYRYMKKPNKY